MKRHQTPAESVAAGLAAMPVGATGVFSKTVGESDVYLFAGLTGDLHRNHVNEEYMRSGPYGGRIAHGALLVGYMSAASSKLSERCPVPVVSYGYDRIRFIKGVRFGDTVTVEYRITEHLPEEAKTLAQVTCTNQRGEVVAAAVHVMKFV
jgi:3-hydroxybutyryl-CoA dehydratase